MPEIKSADAAELARIMGQNGNAVQNGSAPTVSGSNTDSAAAQEGGAKAAAPAAKPYMLFDAGEVQQESGLPGIKFDFNYGARVTVPQGKYRVKFIDREACLTVYDAPASGVLVTSSKKYFIDFRIEVYEKDKLIFAHDLDLQGKKSAAQIPGRDLGRRTGLVPLCGSFPSEASIRTLLRHGRGHDRDHQTGLFRDQLHQGGRTAGRLVCQLLHGHLLSL